MPRPGSNSLFCPIDAVFTCRKPAGKEVDTHRCRDQSAPGGRSQSCCGAVRLLTGPFAPSRCALFDQLTNIVHHSSPGGLSVKTVGCGIRGRIRDGWTRLVQPRRTRCAGLGCPVRRGRTRASWPSTATGRPTRQQIRLAVADTRDHKLRAVFCASSAVRSIARSCGHRVVQKETGRQSLISIHGLGEMVMAKNDVDRERVGMRDGLTSPGVTVRPPHGTCSASRRPRRGRSCRRPGRSVGNRSRRR